MLPGHTTPAEACPLSYHASGVISYDYGTAVPLIMVREHTT